MPGSSLRPASLTSCNMLQHGGWNGRVGDLSLFQDKSVGVFRFLSSEGRAQNKEKLGYDEGNL